MKVFLLCIISLAAVYGVSVSQQTSVPFHDDDEFGFSITSNDAFLLIGSPKRDSHMGANTGVVYVFTKVSAEWTRHSVIADTGHDLNRRFGASVAIGSQFAAVGATLADDSDVVDCGSVTIYVLLNGEWKNSMEFFHPQPQAGDQFGYAIGMTDDLLAVGVPGKDNTPLTDQGQVCFYTRSGDNWTSKGCQYSLQGSIFRLGETVSVHGNIILSGAPGATRSGSDAGMVQSFELQSGTIVKNADVMDGSAPTNAKFGSSVSLDGDLAAIGAPGEKIDTAGNAGAVYIFKYTVSTKVWSQKQKITSANPQENMEFGYSIALKDSTLYVSRPSTNAALILPAVFFYSNATNPNMYEELGAITMDSFENTKRFGRRLTLSSEQLIVGTESAIQNPGEYASAVFVFSDVLPGQQSPDPLYPFANPLYSRGFATTTVGTEVFIAYSKFDKSQFRTTGRVAVLNGVGPGSESGQVKQFAAPLTINDGDDFGTQLSVSNEWLFCSAPGYDLMGVKDVGVVFAFKRQTFGFVQKQLISHSDSSASDTFGLSVVAVPGFLYVGAPKHSPMNLGKLQGAVYEFSQTQDPTWTQDSAFALHESGVSQYGQAVVCDETYMLIGCPYCQPVGGRGRVLPYIKVTNTWTPLNSISLTDYVSSSFGDSLTLSQGRFAVGDSTSYAFGTNVGRVHCYQFQGQGWIPQGSLGPPTTEDNLRFGTSLSMNGTTLLIGAQQYSETNAIGPGRVYVTTFSGSSWLYHVVINPRDVPFSARIGYSVAIMGSLYLAGAPGYQVQSLSGAGALFFFEIDQNMDFKQGNVTLANPEVSAEFGFSISAHGQTVAVGCPSCSGPAGKSGKVYVYSFIGNTPSLYKIIDMHNGQPSVRFGASVFIMNSVVIAGLPNVAADVSYSRGAAHVYQLTEGETVFIKELAPIESNSNMKFGSCIGFNGIDLLIGAPELTLDIGPVAGAVFLFRQNIFQWNQKNKIVLPSIHDNLFFGASLAHFNSKLVIGAPGDYKSPTAPGGVVFLYSLQGDLWAFKQELVSELSHSSDYAGFSVATLDPFIFVGIPRVDIGEDDDAGMVVVFTESSGVWAESQKILPSEPTKEGFYGWSLDAKDGFLIIGHPGYQPLGGVKTGAAGLLKTSGGLWNFLQLLTGPSSTLINFGSDVSIASEFGYIASNKMDVLASTEECVGYLVSSIVPSKSSSRSRSRSLSLSRSRSMSTSWSRTKSQSKSLSRSMSKSISKSQSQTHSNSQSKSLSRSRSKSLSQSQSQTQSNSQSKSQSQSQTHSNSQSQTHSNSQSKSLSKSMSKSQSKSLSKSMSKSLSKSQSQTQSNSQSQSRNPSASKFPLQSESQSKSQSKSLSKSMSKSQSKSLSRSMSKSLSKSQSQTHSNSQSQSRNPSASKFPLQSESQSKSQSLSKSLSKSFSKSQSKPLSQSSTKSKSSSRTTSLSNSFSASRTSTHSAQPSRSPVPTPIPEVISELRFANPRPGSTYRNIDALNPIPQIQILNQFQLPVQTPTEVKVSFSPALPDPTSAAPSSILSKDGIATFTGFQFKGIHGTTYTLLFSVPQSRVSIAWNVSVLTCQQVDVNSEPDPTSGGQACICLPGYVTVSGACNPKDSGVAVAPNAGLFTSERDTQPSAFFDVVLTRVPKSNVQLRIASSNPKEGTPSVASVTFTPTNWQTSQRIGIRGQPDSNNEDGDTPYRIDVGWPTTTDATFQNMQPISVFVTNINVVYPLVYSLDNSIITAQGGIVNITGDYFTRETLVAISTQPTKNNIDTVTVNFISSQRLSVNVTGSFTPGVYLYVTATNPNGASTSCPGTATQQSIGFPICAPENQLYVTTGCPLWTYGDGTTCKACPSNANCPGGNRAWPISGSWSPSEETPPVECFPAEGCVGGRKSNCREGYEDDFCAFCEKGFYKQGPVCRSCQDSGINLSAILTVASVFATIIATIVIVSPSRHLFTLATGLLALQELVQMGLAGSEFIDIPRKLYVSLSWFLLDFNFVRPGCDVPMYPFPEFYLMTLLVIAITLGFFVGCSMLRAVLFAFVWKNEHTTTEYVVKKFKERVAESFTMLGYIAYFLVATRSLQLINCKRVYEEDVMRIELASVCYVEDHMISSIVAWIVLAVYVLGYPIFSFYVLRLRVKSGDDEYRRFSTAVFKTSEFLMDDIRRECFWYRGIELMGACFVCLISVLVQNIPTRIMLLGCIALLNHAVIIAFWPFESNFGTFTEMSVSVAKIVQSIGLLSYYETAEEISYLSILSGVFIVMAILTLFKIHRRGWTLAAPRRTKETEMTEL
eukprot:TRINITY_DN4558_c0_g1_i5.p1 TRINITY_DN4558_c0_g1~~TRINITY_DN4558_c0_g1_i5.p1  ORF type:complete len:2284 (-),score=384.12 TRINITY_DN4558_c0_g1_i5:152-7003(-)